MQKKPGQDAAPWCGRRLPLLEGESQRSFRVPCYNDMLSNDSVFSMMPVTNFWRPCFLLEEPSHTPLVVLAPQALISLTQRLAKYSTASQCLCFALFCFVLTCLIFESC